jgi:uncharacterized protein YuzE
MRIQYYPETDSLYIDLVDRPSADSREVADGVVLDFDSDNKIVGIDIDHARQRLDLDQVVLSHVPPKAA